MTSFATNVSAVSSSTTAALPETGLRLDATRFPEVPVCLGSESVHEGRKLGHRSGTFVVTIAAIIPTYASAQFPHHTALAHGRA